MVATLLSTLLQGINYFVGFLMSMIFDWQEYLNLAKDLSPEGSKPQSQPNQQLEAKYRSAISRAYYAAYNIAYEFAKTGLGYERTRDGKDHQSLIRFYSEQFEKTNTPAFEDISSDLSAMLDLRHKSDYRANAKIKHENAADCIERSEYIIADIDTLKRG
jgi:uncharacterized protein (UPF0332 family)